MTAEAAETVTFSPAFELALQELMDKRLQELLHGPPLPAPLDLTALEASAGTGHGWSLRGPGMCRWSG